MSLIRVSEPTRDLVNDSRSGFEKVVMQRIVAKTLSSLLIRRFDNSMVATMWLMAGGETNTNSDLFIFLRRLALLPSLLIQILFVVLIFELCYDLDLDL